MKVRIEKPECREFDMEALYKLAMQLSELNVFLNIGYDIRYLFSHPM